MKCNIRGCTGEYEPRRVTHTVQRGQQTIVIENVPAEVCPVCGDTLFAAATVRSIEQLLSSPPAPDHTVPAFVFPLVTTPGETATT